MITGITTTYDLYRPFGAGIPTYTNQPCIIYNDFPCGCAGPTTKQLAWSHYMDVPVTADVQDGVTRGGASTSFLYNDGDEIRPSGGPCKLCVVFVTEYYDDTAAAKMKRVYMIRDQWGDY